MKSLGLIFLALAVTLLSACVLPGGGSRDEAENGPDSRVVRDTPTVLIEPQNAPVRPFRAVVLPFGEQGGAPTARSKALTKAFADAWARGQVFAATDYESDQEKLTHEQIILMGRDRGADCVVTGRIGGVQTGGDNDDSTAAVSLEIIDVNSGLCIWSMTESGGMGQERFSFLKRAEDAGSEDSVRTIVIALAYGMGDIIKKWNSKEAYSSPGATHVPVSEPAVHTPPPPPKKPLDVKDLSS